MFFYTISIAAAIFIIMIVVFRLIIHFYFCRRISFRYPGERLKGCPVWTHKDNKGNGEKSALKEHNIADSVQHISSKQNNSSEICETSSEAGREQQNFTKLFAAPPR